MSTLTDALAEAGEALEQTEESKDESVVNEETTSEVAEPVKDAKQEQKPKEAGESFTNIDPNNLPEELRPLYKSLQADYTRKTQALAKQRKELEAKPEVSAKPVEQMTQEEYVKHLIQEEREAEKLSDFRSSAVEYFQKADPRLDENSGEFDEQTHTAVAAEMDRRLSAYVEENGSELGFDYKSTLKEVIQAWDGYLEKQTKRFIERQSQIAKEKQGKIAKLNPSTSSSKGKTKVTTLQEAMDIAASQ